MAETQTEAAGAPTKSRLVSQSARCNALAYALRSDLAPRCRHREVTSARQNIDSFGDLLVVGCNKYSVGHYATVGGGDNIEAQLKFDKRPVVIDQRQLGS